MSVMLYFTPTIALLFVSVFILEVKNKNKKNKLLICKVSKLVSMSAVLYFIPTIALLFVSVFILVFCRCRCNKQRATGGEVQEDPHHFVV